MFWGHRNEFAPTRGAERMARPPAAAWLTKKEPRWVPENPSTNLPTEKRSDGILATFDPALSRTSHVAT